MDFTRRRLLVAAGGACLPLPFLGSLHGGAAFAAEGAHPDGHPLVVVRPGSGVVQAEKSEPERFWPSALGPIDAATLRGRDADRVVAELADHADRLLLVRGTHFPFQPTREEHAGGGNQLLTGARPGPPTPTVMTYAQGESIDNWIARQHPQNGGEPLTLYAGRRENYGEEVLSYRGPGDLRGAEDDPWRAYLRLTGTERTRFASVNDLVLDQLDALQRDAKLSTADRQRLDRHTSAVRDFEVMAATLSADVQARMKDLSGTTTRNDTMLDVARLQNHLIALVLGSGHARAATLQIGDRLDNGHYEVNGRRLPSYHAISHRNVDAADLGDFASAFDMHVEINRLHAQVFAHLLDQLETAEVLDRGIAVMVSDVATGSHSYDQVPWVIAGRGDGTLKQGAYVDAGDVPHNGVLATLLTATGHRTSDGGPIEHFGDESVAAGMVGAMLA